MAINLDNAQYGKFVQFAEQQMQAGNEKAIARDGGARGMRRDGRQGAQGRQGHDAPARKRSVRRRDGA